MDSILEPFPAERLFPAAGPGFLDLGDFSEADFLSNVVRGEPGRVGGGVPQPLAACPTPLLCLRFFFLFIFCYRSTGRWERDPRDLGLPPPPNLSAPNPRAGWWPGTEHPPRTPLGAE